VIWQKLWIIFFFPSPKSEYFFQQHWESEVSLFTSWYWCWMIDKIRNVITAVSLFTSWYWCWMIDKIRYVITAVSLFTSQRYSSYYIPYLIYHSTSVPRCKQRYSSYYIPYLIYHSTSVPRCKQRYSSYYKW
jgi:hypothetical protein